MNINWEDNGMERRIITICLILCMLFTTCATVFAEAEVSTSAEFYLKTAHEAGKFYNYDENGKKFTIEVGPEALTIKVYMVNCEASNVYSGIIELYYDEAVLTCIGARSETGGTYIANPTIPGVVRLAFSTGTEITEDGIILSAAFDYLVQPEEGEDITFNLDVEQLCSDKNGDDKYVDYEIPEGDDYVYEYEEYVPMPEYLYGDTNGDEKVNTADAVVVLKHSAEMLTLTDERFIQADVNFDGKVNTGDAVVILKYCVGMISAFN